MAGGDACECVWECVCAHKGSYCLAAGRGHLKLDDLLARNLHASWALAECLQGAQATRKLLNVPPPLEATLEYIEAEHEELQG